MSGILLAIAATLAAVTFAMFVLDRLDLRRFRQEQNEHDNEMRNHQ